MVPLIWGWATGVKAVLKALPTIALVAVLVGLLLSVFVNIKAADTATKKLNKQEQTLVDVRQDLADTQANLVNEKRNIKTVTEYVERVTIVRQRGATIIKEVPIYVSKEADSQCAVPNGFVWMHDNAATSSTVVANTPSPDYAGPSGVALSQVAATVAYNYQQFHEMRQQTLALQQWITNNTTAPPLD